jgi:hypothetical protein
MALVTSIFVVLTAGTAIYLVTFVKATLRDPAGLLPLMVVGLGIGLLWLMFVSIHSLWE